MMRMTSIPALAVLAMLSAPPTLYATEDEIGIFGTPPEALVTALTTLAIFIVLLVVLGRYAWGPIVTGLKAREERIRKEIADAEEARAKAESTLREYNSRLADAEGKVREMIAKAAADGERVAANIRLQAQKETEDLKARANKDIEATRDRALAEITERAAELATDIAAKILRRNLNVEDQRDLINGSLEQLEAIKG